MPRKYKVGQRPKKRSKKALKTLLVLVVIFGVIGGLIYWDSTNNKGEQVRSISRPVEQKADIQSKQISVNEPFFSMQLSNGWKEIERKNIYNETSITWQSKIKNEDNRWLKLYIDVVPPNVAINRVLPLDVNGSSLSYRQLSDNCEKFTTHKNDRAIVAQASKWQDIEFVCDLPNYVQNKVGTATSGMLNGTKVTGPTKGTHRYFFVYTDHNIRPDYTIFYNALKSFKAK